MPWSLRALLDRFRPDPVAILAQRGYHLVDGSYGAPPSLIYLMHENRRAGFIELSWSSLDTISNFGIMIYPAYRNRGLGTLLLQALIALARNRGVATIHGLVRRQDLAAQPHLLRWYRENGFATIEAQSIVTAAWLLFEFRRGAKT